MALKHADFYAEPSRVAAAEAAKEVDPTISASTTTQPEEPIATSIKNRNASSVSLIYIRHRSVWQKRLHVRTTQNLAIGPNAVGPANTARSLRVRQELC